jgi:DNA topoisomerase VI subunit B
VFKELLDNALDAPESARVPPDIVVTVEPDALSDQDNGPGLPASTLERSLDYAVRVSDKSYYVSPTRGQLGNALKCLWAAPFVADGEHGRVTVETGGQRHTVDVRLDRIAGQPKIDHQVSPDGRVPKARRSPSTGQG